MKFKFKKNHGITLIALVVTIIVLLILAGISITMLTGQNGILNRAKESKEQTSMSQKKEKLALSNMEELIDENVNETNVEKVNDIAPGKLEQETENVLVINSIEDLVFFAYDVRNGNNYEGKTVKLGNSLDFNSNKSYVDPFRTDYENYGYNDELKTLLTSGEGFQPIGTLKYTEAEVNHINTFAGTFDGNSNVIFNLNVNREITYTGENYEEYKLGLFGYNMGIIKNVAINNCNINVRKISGNCNVFAGAIVGQNNGEINNCSVSGNVSSNFITGGIAGRNKNKIESSYNEASIYGKARVSGVSGDGTNEATFSKCYNAGEIVAKDENSSGISGAGISAGGNLIEECFNSGKINVQGKENSFAYGIGDANNIYNCYNSGEVYSEILHNENQLNYAVASGICSYWGKTISNCYNSGKIIAKGNLGIIRASGIAYGCTIEDSYNFGEIETIGTENTKNQIGGISANAERNNITNCYNTGIIKSEAGITENNFIGGICGINATLTNCSYLSSTAEKGIGNGTDIATRVEDEKDMPNILSILGDKFKNSSNSKYPILNWQ